MHSPFIEKLNEKNLASWYMLPLMDLSVKSFGESNFVDAYQVKGKAMIVVAVKHFKFCLTVCKNQSFNKTGADERCLLFCFQYSCMLG